MKKLLFILLLSPLFSYSHCIIETARKEIGVMENGKNNSGERIAIYLAHTKIYTPSPWCSSFVAYILSQCGVKHTITAWSPSATAKNRIYDRRYPEKNKVTPEGGDVFTLYYSSMGRISHTGFVESWDTKWVTTIEGNTNNGGTRETTTGSDGVFRRKRLVKTIYQVSRWR